MRIESPSLLITDDDRDFRETMAELFQRRGFQTLLAADGEEAVRIVSSATDVHIVMLDLHMPKLDGLKAIEQIKHYRSRLPWILVSASLDEEVRRQAHEAFSVLAKPVSFQEVTQTVCLAMRSIYDWPPSDEGDG